MTRRLISALSLTLPLATLAGLAWGLWAGWPYAEAGHPLLGLALWRQGVDQALGVGLVAGLVLAAGASLGAGAGRAWGLPTGALAAAPAVALIGYHLNRWLGVRPQEVFGSYARGPNLALLAAGAALAVVLALLVSRLGAVRPSSARGRLAATAGVVIALHLAAAAWFRPGIDKPRPDVLLLLVDALRADHLSSYGYPRATTPALDALAVDGVRFDQAIASSTFTKTSVASLLTGRHPYEHGVYWGHRRETPGRITSDLLAADELTLAEALAEHGYLTEAWVQNSHLRSFMGFGQGFVHYRDQQGSIARIHRLARRFLRGPGRRVPWFAYLHYIDLHDPYRPEPTYAARFAPDDVDPYQGIELAEWGAYLGRVRSGEVVPPPQQLARFEALYDAQLRYIDDQIGAFLDLLRQERRYQDTLIVVTSDHGDAFGEHGVISHSTAPYEELVRVPLIVKLPRGRFAGTVVEDQVRLVDLYPTLLEAVGAAAPPTVSGCSLWPLLRGGQLDERCATAVSEIALEEELEPTVGIRETGWKYLRIDGRREELYDLRSDPGERRDLTGDPEAAAILDRLRQRALAVAAARASDNERLPLDEATIRELQALGYL